MFETGTGVSITAPGMRGSGVAGTTLGGSVKHNRIAYGRTDNARNAGRDQEDSYSE